MRKTARSLFLQALFCGIFALHSTETHAGKEPALEALKQSKETKSLNQNKVQNRFFSKTEPL
jgi:hypothetical protein